MPPKKSRKTEASSLQKTAQVTACRQLRDFVEGERCSASFACGGTISIGDPIQEENPGTSHVSPPVTIGWSDEATSPFSGKLLLPLNDTPVSNQDVVEQLVQACSPATFGRGDQDVLDTSYRKAGKLDVDKFLSSFHPANFGIVDHVEQILLPSVSTDMENKLQFRRITADLYKLNIYSGPSGLFRAHVDTPRSDSQVGSLVVCLPSPFKGGNLIIRHHGREVDYDWSSESASAIQWAAFYSDCEHEIKEVTEGHRITLTYNLFVSEPVKSIIIQNPVFKPACLPLFEYVQGLIQNPGFMRKGGTLGLFCAHAYAHNSRIAKASFPKILKGSDMVLYSVFKALGVNVEIRPVLEYNGRYHAENEGLRISGVVPSATSSPYLEEDEEDYPYNSDESDESDDSRSTEYKRSISARIGMSFNRYRTTESCEDEGEDRFDEIASDVCPFDFEENITWLTEPKHEEMAFTNLTYGNQPGLETHYSCAAILADIPSWSERAKAAGLA